MMGEKSASHTTGSKIAAREAKAGGVLKRIATRG
jgi:hypothetical protein